MKTLSCICLIAVLFCCSEQNRTTRKVSGKLTNQITQTSGIIKYMYDNTLYKQVIEIKNLSEIEIEFKINTEDKKTGELSVIQGVAKRKINVDPEIDEDDKGEGYYSLQYIYINGECKLSIRIAADTKDLLKLDSFNCYLIGEKDGLFTLGVLLKRIN